MVDGGPEVGSHMGRKGCNAVATCLALIQKWLIYDTGGDDQPTSAISVSSQVFDGC